MIDYSLCFTISPAKLQKNSTNKKHLSKKSAFPLWLRNPVCTLFISENSQDLTNFRLKLLTTNKLASFKTSLKPH